MVFVRLDNAHFGTRFGFYYLHIAVSQIETLSLILMDQRTLSPSKQFYVYEKNVQWAEGY